MGRKTRLTPAVAKAVIAALSHGASIRAAVKHAGIGRTTYHSWLTRGARESGVYRDFSDAVQAARAQWSAQLNALDGTTSKNRHSTTHEDTMTDEKAERAAALLATLLDGAIPKLPAPVEALHARWAARSLGNTIVIESPAHPDQWVLTLVTPGWPRGPEHRIESGSLTDAVREANRWLDEVHNG